MLNPDNVRRKNGLIINEFFITQHNDYCAAAPKNLLKPQNIVIYSFKDMPIKPYMSQADFCCRQIYYNNFKGFLPHYCIDQLGIWQLLELNQQSNFDNDNIIIVICGLNKKILPKAAELVCRLLEKFQLNLKQVKTNNEELQLLLKEKSQSFNLPEFFEDEIIKNISEPPQLSFEVLFNNEWQKPKPGNPIRAIKINASEGELQYRTHIINGNWLPWVFNGEMSGNAASYIDGFQIKYANKKYKILYRFSILNSKLISWRSTNINIPTKHYIDNFEFKVE